MERLMGIDWLVIAAYFGVLIVIVWFASRRQQTSTDYFLAGCNVGFFAMGASIFASNIGSEHIVGLAGQGAVTGMARAHWELHAWIAVLLAWVLYRSTTAPACSRCRNSWKRIRGLTYASIDRAAVRASWNWVDVAGTVVVLGLVALVYLCFSFWI